MGVLWITLYIEENIIIWNDAGSKSSPTTTAFVNGAPQGVQYHDKDNWTAYVSPYMVVGADRFTKHYYAGTQRIASKIGVGVFSNLYGDGNATQFVAYTPFGESLVDEHAVSYESPYKFNGKEMDAETGLYYYGVRYYDPSLALWYGVDALAEKYPSLGGEELTVTPFGIRQK